MAAYFNYSVTDTSITCYLYGLLTDVTVSCSFECNGTSKQSTSAVGYSTCTPVTFSGLTPGTTYTVHWSSYGGYIADSGNESVTTSGTRPPDPPTFSIGSYQPNGYTVSVSVSCSNPDGVTNSARIVYRTNDSSTWIDGEAHPQTTSSWTDTLSVTVPSAGTYIFGVRTWYSGQGSGSIVNQQTIIITEPENNTWVYVNGWKRAQPWVYVNNSWHKATPYVYVNDSWHKV